MGLFVNLGLTTSYAALLSGGGGGGSGDANFGALTLAGAGGVAKPAPSTSISNDGGTNLTIVSGMVVPDTGGFGTAGTVVFNDGTEWTVTATANTYSVLADQAEIEAAAADAPLSSTRTISVRDGTATGDRVDLTGLVFTGGLTVRSTLMGATLPGIDWSGSQKITLTGLVIYRPWSAPDAFDEVIHSNATSNCTMINCAVSSNDFSADDFYTTQPNVLAGIGAAGGSTMDNMTITDNTFTWVNRALYATGSDGVDFQRNTIQHVYGNFAELHGDNWTFKDNRGSGVWAHGGGLGQTGPNNPTGSASLYPYDWGDPHSSLFGTGSSGDNQVFMGNVLVIGPEREAIKGDYPGIGSGPKWNDPIPSATVTYSNVVCKYNVLGVSDNTGIVVGYMRDSVVSHNTIFYDTDYGTGATPNIYYSELGDNVVISHNVACSLVYGTAGGSIFVPDSTYEIGHENIIALPIGNSGTIDGDAIEYGELFAGPTFAGIAAADAIATLTPRAGRRLATGAVQIGAVGPYYNFTTGVETAPTWTKPLTATQTGVDLDRVQFGSGEFFTITQSSPFLGVTNADECTIMFGLQLDAASDGTDFYIVIEAGFGVSVRRLPTGRLRIGWEDSAGDTSALMDTNLTFDSSDGYTVWTISARFSTYDIRVMKGTTLDPFIAVSAWNGNAMTTSRSTITVTPGADTNLSFFLLDDAFLDLHDAATMARVIARNGQHPAHGADGSTVMGSQPLIYLTGDATAWNADTLQLGSIAAPAVVTGTLADVTVTAPAQIGAGDWSVVNERSGSTAQVTISTFPANNNGTITAYEYQIDGGSWVDAGALFTGVVGDLVFDITGLTDGVEVAVAIRAVNSAGAGTASASKNVTPTTVVAPTAFAIGDWSVVDASSGNEVTVTIATLPSNGGDPLDSIEYRIDGGAWVDIGGVVTGDYAITGLTNEVEIDIELRQSNSLFSSATSDVKTVTPTLSANTVPDPGFDDAGVWDAGTGWAVTGGKAVATGATGFQTLNMKVANRATVDAATVYDFGLTIDSVGTAARMRVSLREYTGATQGTFFYIYDTNTDGALSVGTISKLGAHTTSAGVTSVRIGLEAVGAITATFDDMVFQAQ